MRLIVFASALSFMIAGVTQAPQIPQVELRSVGGVITEAGGTKAVPGVQVALLGGDAPRSPREQSSPLAAVTTDANGQFRFSNVAVGFYVLQMQREGYFRPGAESPSATNESLTVSLRVPAGQDVKGLAYSLTAGGIISGRVVDAAGNPVAGVPITVLQQGYDPNGKRLLYSRNLEQAREGLAQTNDKGEYRLFWLTPGEYYIRAEVTAGYVSTFHPAEPPLAPRATIREIMESIVDPSADFLFESVAQIVDEKGIRDIEPRTDEEWAMVRRHALILLEAPNLLTMEGRKVAKPEERAEYPEAQLQPEETQKMIDGDRASFKRRAKRMQDATAEALTAIDAKDKTALFNALTKIDHACENCHLHYWYPNDKRAWEAAKEEGLVVD